MKKCYKCNVLINTKVQKCPLCSGSIEDGEKGENIFPTIPNIYVKHKLFFKIHFENIISNDSIT